MNIIKISNLNKNFQNQSLFNNFNLTLKGNGLFFITGKSGSGKTTLLNIIANIDQMDAGQINFKVANKNVSLKSTTKSFPNHFKIDYVFQNYNLINGLSAEKNIKIALNLNKQNINSSKIENEFNKIDITKKTLKTKVEDLSTGEKQRTAILRSTLRNSDILLADEPTGNLDIKNSKIIMTELKNISKTKPVIVVSHNLKLAREFGDTIIGIRDGKLDFTNVLNKPLSLSPLISHIPISSSAKEKNPISSITKEKKEKSFFYSGFLLAYKDIKIRLIQSFLIVFTLVFSLLSFSTLFNVSQASQNTNYNFNVNYLQTDKVVLDNVNSVKQEQLDDLINQYSTSNVIKTFAVPNFSLSFGSTRILMNKQNYQKIKSNEFFTNRIKPFIKGEFIANKNEIIISRDLATNFFGKTKDPIGKILTLKVDDFFTTNLKIVGVNEIRNNLGTQFDYFHIDIIEDLSKAFYKQSRNFESSTKFAFKIKQLSNSTLSEGTKPQKINEVVLSPNFKKDFEIGDKIFANFELQSSPTLIITGFLKDPSSHQEALFSDEGFTHFTTPFINKKILYLSDPNDVPKLEKAILENFPTLKLTTNLNALTQSVQQSSNLISFILLAVIAILIISTIALVLTYSKIVLDSKKKDLAILKILGVKRQLSSFFHLLNILIIGVIAYIASLIFYYPFYLLSNKFLYQVNVSALNHIINIGLITCFWILLLALISLFYYLSSLKTFKMNTALLLK